MSKIDDFIKAHSLKPRDCEYHTNRNVMGTKPSALGKIRVLVPKSDNVARVEYVCPECKHTEYVEQPWKRPFYIKCAKCSHKIGVPKMKQQFKKEQKMEKAAKD